MKSPKGASLIWNWNLRLLINNYFHQHCIRLNQNLAQEKLYYPLKETNLSNDPSQWWTYRRQEKPSAKANAPNTPSTRWPNTRKEKTRKWLRVDVVMTANSVVSEARPSRFFERRPRPPRRLYYVLSVPNVSTATNWLWRDVSTLRLEETRRERDKWSSSRRESLNKTNSNLKL